MDSVPHLKRCYVCGAHKPLDQFYRDRNSKDGHQRRCKDCHRVWWREYGPGYEQRRRETNPEYNERWLAYKRRKDQEWREQNPDKNRENYQKVNRRRSEDSELRAKYTKYQRERRQERQRTDPAFHQRLMEQAIAGRRRRLARLAKADGSYTQAEWDRLCAYYDHRCVACGEHRPLTRDHVVPLSKGGTDSIDNLQPLCGPCNSRKHNRAIDYRPNLPPWMGSED